MNRKQHSLHSSSFPILFILSILFDFAFNNRPDFNLTGRR
jgi:hypothetical protein